MPKLKAAAGPVPVALVVRKLDWGGIERDVAKLAIGLDRSLFSPHVVVFEPGGLRYDEVERAGVPIFNMGVANLTSPRTISIAARLAQWLVAKRIRLMHSFDGTIFFCAPIARAVRTPVILGSTLGHRDLFSAKVKKHLAFADRLIDRIVVNCHAMERHMMEDYGFLSDRILLSYNGVETSEFFPLAEPKPEPVADASLLIGSVCVLRPEKRMEMLVEAFAAVRSLRPGIKLLIIGGGSELPRLQARADELNLGPDCIFFPAVKRVAPYLRAIDIFVSCSSSEAFSNSILEAMACGCCPVGSRVGGTPELIADGDRGLLFESGNVSDLVSKLSALINDEALRKRYARAAALFAAQELSMDVALARMSRIYREQLQEKGRWDR